MKKRVEKKKEIRNKVLLKARRLGGKKFKEEISETEVLLMIDHKFWMSECK